MLHVFTGTLDKLLDFDNRDNSLHRTDWKPTVSFIDESEMDETDNPAYSQEAMAGVLGGMILKRLFRGVFDSNIKGNVYGRNEGVEAVIFK